MARPVTDRLGAERRYAWLIALAVLTGILGAAGNVLFRTAIAGAGWVFQHVSAPLGRPGIPVALLAGGLVLLLLDRLFPGEVLGYGFPRFLEMLHLQGARVKRRWMVVKTLGAAISLGSGAAVGREGPIARAHHHHHRVRRTANDGIRRHPRSKEIRAFLGCVGCRRICRYGAVW